MNCKLIQDELPELALEHSPASPELEAHLRTCAECSRTLESLKATMSLLDEWQAPEPSPYWDVRFQARLREEQNKAARGWLSWLRRPALSLAAALCLVTGVGLYQVTRFMEQGNKTDPTIAFRAPAPTGTAVADLLYLSEHQDLLQNFDALDVLDGDDDADTSN
jgi:anti-sigma factor RsiW